MGWLGGMGGVLCSGLYCVGVFFAHSNLRVSENPSHGAGLGGCHMGQEDLRPWAGMRESKPCLRIFRRSVFLSMPSSRAVAMRFH